MEWIYENPLKKKERDVVKQLNKSFHDKELSEKIVKALSLLEFLSSHTFHSPKQLHESVFYDKDKTHLIFTLPQATKILKALKKEGGSEYPLTNKLIGKTTSYIQSIDPTPISWGVGKTVGLLEWPMKSLENSSFGPVVEVGTGAVHGLVEAGVSAGNGIGEAIGGPIGLAVVAPFTGLAAAIASCLAIAEGDLGQSIVHAVNFIPAVGPALVKVVGKMEHMAKVVDSKREKLQNIPVVGSTLVSVVPTLKDEEIPVSAGKRFSTRKHIKNNRWKTQRKKLGKH